MVALWDAGGSLAASRRDMGKAYSRIRAEAVVVICRELAPPENGHIKHDVENDASNKTGNNGTVN